jgi:hypothetical protein
VQAANFELSSLQRNVAATPSENEKVAPVANVGSAGLAVIVGAGGTAESRRKDDGATAGFALARRVVFTRKALFLTPLG